jgi:hypothetical protein
MGRVRILYCDTDTHYLHASQHESKAQIPCFWSPLGVFYVSAVFNFFSCLTLTPGLDQFTLSKNLQSGKMP